MATDVLFNKISQKKLANDVSRRLKCSHILLRLSYFLIVFYTTLSFSDEQVLKHINPLLKVKPIRKV